jgi:hypothetical protein
MSMCNVNVVLACCSTRHYPTANSHKQPATGECIPNSARQQARAIFLRIQNYLHLHRNLCQVTNRLLTFITAETKSKYQSKHTHSMVDGWHKILRRKAHAYGPISLRDTNTHIHIISTRSQLAISRSRRDKEERAAKTTAWLPRHLYRVCTRFYIFVVTTTALRSTASRRRMRIRRLDAFVTHPQPYRTPTPTRRSFRP